MKSGGAGDFAPGFHPGYVMIASLSSGKPANIFMRQKKPRLIRPGLLLLLRQS
jgi:hypothetical protein